MSNRLIQGMLCLSVLLFSPVMMSADHRIAPLGIDALRGHVFNSSLDFVRHIKAGPSYEAYLYAVSSCICHQLHYFCIRSKLYFLSNHKAPCK